MLQDASNIPDAIIKKLSNEKIELSNKMHLICLSNRMFIAELWNSADISEKYISQFGCLLSPQDIKTYKLSNHKDFSKLISTQ